MRRMHFLPALLLAVNARHSIAQQGAAITIPAGTTVVVLGSVAPVTVGESARTAEFPHTQQPPLAFQTIEDYIRTDASVDIEQREAAGVLSDISLRGASFEQTLVLVNGLRMDSAETAHFNLDLPIPLLTIERIDVLHGDGSTLYGSDGIGGVVDVRTMKPSDTALRFKAGAGSFGENEQAVLGSIAEKNWSDLLAGDREFSTRFTTDRDYRTENASNELRFASALGNSDLLFA